MYQTKNARQTETFDALEWLAAMCSHVPNRGEQMVRYYGYYSNVKRGKRKKDQQDDSMPFVMEEAGVSPEKRKAWARLIQKIYVVDPLTSPQCQRNMTPLLSMVSKEIDEIHSTRLNPCRGMPS